MSIVRILIASVSLLLPLCAQDTAKPAAPAAKAAVAVQQQSAKPYHVVAAYPLGTCVVSGEKLDADAVTFQAGGRTFMTCCKKCQAKVEKDPAPFAAKLDAAIVAQQAANYPLTNCPISGKKLGAMGDPHKLVLNGALVELCCDGCVEKATAKAAAITEQILDAAYAAQAANYPLKTCAASGEKLGADVYDVMYGTRLIRFCCKDCVDDLKKDPTTILAKLDAAQKKSEPAGDAAEKGATEGTKKKEGAVAPTSLKEGKAGGCCGDTCVDGATGGCCKDGAKAPAAKKPEVEKKID